MNVLQIGAGKPVVGNFCDAAVLHIAAKQPRQHGTDLRFSFAALALEDTKRFNTITQYLGRGTLDEQTAAMMKALAKSKLEKALQDNDYAQGSYAAEMEQAALLAEAKANRKQ